MMAEYLALKWGTMKEWRIETERSKAAYQKYVDAGMSFSAMEQQHTAAHKQALCELIDAIDGEIRNDWSGSLMTKDEAKRYVLRQDRDKSPAAAHRPE